MKIKKKKLYLETVEFPINYIENLTPDTNGINLN